ncbi:hypothetical protein [Vibrio campbellii]|uniref:hypothetical protein n=1 Tax=Vibrio campbellii TaxID=680 RepID=UPI00249AFED4|nr:hypothetical protein [Vibrio campbellii]
MPRYRREYHLVSPDGIRFYTDNLAEFCRIHRLNERSVRNLVYGKVGSYYGWTLDTEHGEMEEVFIDNRVANRLLHAALFEITGKRFKLRTSDNPATLHERTQSGKDMITSLCSTIRNRMKGVHDDQVNGY